MKTFKKIIPWVALALIFAVALAAYFTRNYILLCMSYLGSFCYLMYVILDWYDSRKRYYFVSFYKDGNYGNANIVLKQSMKIRLSEDFISKKLGGGKVIILTFKRISREQYDEMRKGNDNAK